MKLLLLIRLVSRKLMLPTIVFICIFFSLGVLAQARQQKLPIKGFTVKILKRKEEHIKIAALSCALAENNASIRELRAAWDGQLLRPITSDDQFLVIDIMKKMCPEIHPEKLLKAMDTITQ